jgi:hypothetical protein
LIDPPISRFQPIGAPGKINARTLPFANTAGNLPDLVEDFLCPPGKPLGTIADAENRSQHP